MIKINLVAEARADKVARAPLISMGSAGLNNFVILGLLICAIAFVGVQYWRLTSTLAGINKEMVENQREYDRLKPIIEEVEAFKKRNAELKHKIDVIEQLKANQFGPVRIMDEVSKALPDLLWLTNLDLEGNVISLRGQALDENAVANLIANLAACPFFGEPTLRIMQQDERGVRTFDLFFTFTYTPRGTGSGAGARS